MKPRVVARALTGYTAYDGLPSAVQEAFCRGVIRIRERLAKDEESKQYADQEQLMHHSNTLLATLPRVQDVLPAPDPDSDLKGLRVIDAELIDRLANYHGGNLTAAMMELQAFSVTVRRLLEVLPDIEPQPDPHAVGRQFLEVCLIRDLFEDLRIPLDYELAARVTACTGQEIVDKAFRQRLRRGNRREWRRVTVSSKNNRKV
jgi:hypothetical protein